MITVTPQGNIYLCNVPLENDYKNQLTFTNAEAQQTYFNSKIVTSFDNYTYMKKDSVIKVGVNIDDIIGCNYLFYRNTGFTNRIYYCFITNKEYINENVTALTIETDVFQTYQFDIEYKTCFIEREHVNNDTMGANTIPENLELGDYISCKLQPESNAIEYCYVIAASDLTGVFQSYTYSNFKIPTGLYYIGLTDMTAIRQVINLFDSAGRGNAIVTVFVSPKAFFSSWNTVTGIVGQVSLTCTSTMTVDYTITRVDYLGNDYIPKNNKLKCFPYSFLQVSNHTGQIYNYKWENFDLFQAGLQNAYKFRLRGAMTPGGSFKAFPLNYNNILNNNDDTIALGKFPIGSFTNDIYTNWLTQNGVNILGHTIPADRVALYRGLGAGLSEGMDIGQAFGVQQGIVGGAVRTAENVFDSMQEVYRASLVPDNVSGNINSGDINFEFNLNVLEFKRMSIKNEYARKIDNYFQMYGYKVNEVKTPNVTGRTYWNYVKTIGCELGGDIPMEHLNVLKGIFNNGVTFWHDPSNMFNYSLTNSIVT